MTCFLQVAEDGDLDVITGNLIVESNAATVLANKLTNRFRFFKGEWFIDTREGVPYFQYVFVKNPDLNAISQMFKKVLLTTPGVASVVKVQCDFYTNLRQLVASFECVTDTGAVIAGGPGDPFIVVLNNNGKQ